MLESRNQGIKANLLPRRLRSLAIWPVIAARFSIALTSLPSTQELPTNSGCLKLWSCSVVLLLLYTFCGPEISHGSWKGALENFERLG